LSCPVLWQGGGGVCSNFLASFVFLKKKNGKKYFHEGVSTIISKNILSEKDAVEAFVRGLKSFL